MRQQKIFSSKNILFQMRLQAPAVTQMEEAVWWIHSENQKWPTDKIQKTVALPMDLSKWQGAKSESENGLLPSKEWECAPPSSAAAPAWHPPPCWGWQGEPRQRWRLSRHCRQRWRGHPRGGVRCPGGKYQGDLGGQHHHHSPWWPQHHESKHEYPHSSAKDNIMAMVTAINTGVGGKYDVFPTSNAPTLKTCSAKRIAQWPSKQHWWDNHVSDIKINSFFGDV